MEELVVLKVQVGWRCCCYGQNGFRFWCSHEMRFPFSFSSLVGAYICRQIQGQWRGCSVNPRVFCESWGMNSHFCQRHYPSEMAWDARAFTSTLHLSFWKHLCFFVTTHYFQIVLCSAKFWHFCYELLLVVVAVPIGAIVYQCLEFYCANVLQHMWGESTLIIALLPAALHLWIWDEMSMKR